MIKLGEFVVPSFDAGSTMFGARLNEYPKYRDIPEFYRNFSAQSVAGNLFFSGGKLANHKLKLRENVDSNEFYSALKSYLSSFEPKHEHKMSACSWLIAECTEEIK